MGGCRCTYRNCSLRTDGKTHMFHYPVFDKVRCHQWLTNARKLEFLNLKVSQLKNRVVCQHHFKDENFMNFRKDKLTFDAVPTEDGPYCNSSVLEDKKPEQDDTKAYSISLDDIENEYLTIIDKKANFSVKYGDFLTNCDLMDLETLSQMNRNSKIAIQELYVEPCLQDQMLDQTRTMPPSRPERSVTQIFREKSSDTSSNNILNDNANNIHHNNILDIHKQCGVQQVEENLDTSNITLNVSHVPIEFEQLNQQYQENPVQSFEMKVFDETKPLYENMNPSQLNERKKIRIISEKKISEPVPLIGKLEPVSPTRILTLINKNKGGKLVPVENTSEVSSNSTKEIRVELPLPLENNSVIEKVKHNTAPRKLIYVDSKNKDSPPNINNKNNTLSKTPMEIKNKIPPERVAAIAEKRKFNMKLRDIIEDCLDKLDDPINQQVSDDRKMSHNSRTVQSNKKKVSSHLAKEPDLPNVQEYTIAYLEARMKKMENNLINKIDQNSQRIVELKETISSIYDKKTVHTQTLIGGDQHKKQLYQEISKYLSREANSLIYEELFINKYTPEVPKCTPTKRRKNR